MTRTGFTVVFLLASMLLAPPAGAWENLAPMDQARYDFAGGFPGDDILVYGGAIAPTTFSNTFASYSPTVNAWTDLPTNNGVRPAVKDVSGVLLGDKFYVFGASVIGGEGMTNYAYRHDLQTGVWESFDALGFQMPPLRVANAPTVAFEGKIYRFGGYFVNEESEVPSQRREVYQFDPATGLWTLMNYIPYQIASPGAAVVDGIAYLVGGSTTNGFSSAVLGYDLATNEWLNNGNAIGHIPTPRALYTGAPLPVMDGRIYVSGGWWQAFAAPGAALETFDTATRLSWSNFTLGTGLADHLSAIIDGWHYVVGGRTQSAGDGIKTVRRLAIDTDLNGILDKQQLAEDDDTDLNGDFIRDVTQPGVIKDAKTVSGNAIWGVCVEDPATGLADPNIFGIDVVEALTGSTFGTPPRNFTQGLLYFRLAVAEGSTVTATVYLSEDIPSAAKWTMYDRFDGWHDYSARTTFVDARTVLLELEDGGAGDADGAVNGSIYMPGGPSLYIEPTPEPEPDIEDYFPNNNNCFIRSVAPGAR